MALFDDKFTLRKKGGLGSAKVGFLVLFCMEDIVITATAQHALTITPENHARNPKRLPAESSSSFTK